MVTLWMMFLSRQMLTLEKCSLIFSESKLLIQNILQKAFSYWKNNFVDTILVSTIDEKRLVMKCKVTPSQRIRDESRELWICLDNGGIIICGWCSFTTAGTLYKMEYAYSQGYTNPSCTSVYDGLVYVRLIKFLAKHILNENQFGFRSNRSTIQAILLIADKIQRAIADKKISCGIFLDLSKAFDTVDHTILI